MPSKNIDISILSTSIYSLHFINIYQYRAKFIDTVSIPSNGQYRGVIDIPRAKAKHLLEMQRIGRILYHTIIIGNKIVLFDANERILQQDPL